MTESAPVTPGAAAEAARGDAAEALQLQRQNAYLKQRCAQLQEDVTNLDAQVIRLQQELERLRGRRADPQGEVRS